MYKLTYESDEDVVGDLSSSSSMRPPVAENSKNEAKKITLAGSSGKDGGINLPNYSSTINLTDEDELRPRQRTDSMMSAVFSAYPAPGSSEYTKSSGKSPKSRKNPRLFHMNLADKTVDDEMSRKSPCCRNFTSGCWQHMAILYVAVLTAAVVVLFLLLRIEMHRSENLQHHVDDLEKSLDAELIGVEERFQQIRIAESSLESVSAETPMYEPPTPIVPTDRTTSATNHPARTTSATGDDDGKTTSPIESSGRETKAVSKSPDPSDLTSPPDIASEEVIAFDARRLSTALLSGHQYDENASGDMSAGEWSSLSAERGAVALAFEWEDVNQRRNIDPRKGVFRVPLDGAYWINVVVCTRDGAVVNIVVNGEPVRTFRALSSDDRDEDGPPPPAADGSATRTRDFSAELTLRAGDRLRLRLASGAIVERRDHRVTGACTTRFAGLRIA